MKGQILKEGKRGFTLVELIVVIAILAILAAVAYPVYNGYIDYTHKGVDRQTVGEIMRALDIAGFSNPELLADGGTAAVFVTSSGTFTNDSAVKAAIEDAMGDISAVKLSSDDWNGINGDIIAQLKKKDGRLDSYMTYINDDHPKASFASDFSDYWEIYKDVTSLLTSEGIDVTGSGTPLKVDPSKYDEKSMTGHILAGYSSGTVNADEVVDAWSRQFAIAGEVTGVQFSGFDLELARNYAFLSYAQRLDTVASNANLAADIENYADQLANREKIAKPFFQNDIFTKGDNASDWSGIISTYLSSQAPSDAKAYLALMECGGLVYDDYASKGKTPSDEEIAEALGGYVSLAGSVMDGSSNLDDIQSFINSGTQGITITAKRNSDGTMILKVNPNSANPRKDNETNSPTPAEPEEPGEPGGECTLTHTNRFYVAVTAIGALNGSTEKVSDSKVGAKASTIEICSINKSAASCTLELLDGVTNGSITVTGGDDSCITKSGLTISAVKKGTCTIKLTATVKKNDESLTKTLTLTVNVH